MSWPGYAFRSYSGKTERHRLADLNNAGGSTFWIIWRKSVSDTWVCICWAWIRNLVSKDLLKMNLRPAPSTRRRALLPCSQILRSSLETYRLHCLALLVRYSKWTVCVRVLACFRRDWVHRSQNNINLKWVEKGKEGQRTWSQGVGITTRSRPYITNAMYLPWAIFKCFCSQKENQTPYFTQWSNDFKKLFV